MIHSAPPPFRPGRHLTELLTRPDGGHDVTVEPGPPAGHLRSIVRRGPHAAPQRPEPARMAALVAAMLARSPHPWTVNGTPVRAPHRPPERWSVSTLASRDGRTLEDTLAGPPGLSVNCRIDGVAAFAIRLERAARQHLVELHHAPQSPAVPVAKLTARPIIELTGQQAANPAELLAAAERFAMPEEGHPEAAYRTSMPPEIPPEERVWIRSRANHPAELERSRPEAELVVVRHAVPAIIRSDKLTWAELASAMITVEEITRTGNDPDPLVPVVTAYRTPIRWQGPRPLEAWASIDPQGPALTLQLPGQETRRYPMPILATGRFDPEDTALPVPTRHPAAPQLANPREALLRCYLPSMNDLLRRTIQLDTAGAAMLLSRMVDVAATELR